MTDVRTWIRVEDETGQWDHDKSRSLPKGATVVKGYPEHVGRWARDPKPRVRKGGDAAVKTDDKKAVATT